jgi:hypothetical protein
VPGRGAGSLLKLRLSKKGIRLVRRALQKRRSLTPSVTVLSTDAAGNSRLAKRKIKLVG